MTSDEFFLALKYLQEERLHHLSGQPELLLSFPRGERFSLEAQCASHTFVHVHFFLSSWSAQLRRAQLPLLDDQ